MKVNLHIDCLQYRQLQDLRLQKFAVVKYLE